MTIKDFEKKYHNIVLMPFMNENVRVLRNKKTGEWKFFKEEDGILSSLPEEVNNKLVEMYRPKPDVYSVEIGYGKAFEEGELPVFSNFAQEPVSSKNTMRKEAKKACFTVNGEKISLNIANLTYKETTRFPEINNENFTCFENLKFIFEENGYGDKEIVKFLKRLDRYTIFFDDTGREYDYAGCCSVSKPQMHILQQGRQFNNEETTETLDHEALHAATKVVKGEDIYFGFSKRDGKTGAQLYNALMEGTTGCLTGGYPELQKVIRALLGVRRREPLPKQWVRAYLDSSPEDLVKYVTKRFHITKDMFDAFSSKLDSYLVARKEAWSKTIKSNEIEIAKSLVLFKMNERIANGEKAFDEQLFMGIFGCFNEIDFHETSKIIVDAISSKEFILKGQEEKNNLIKELCDMDHWEYSPRVKTLFMDGLSKETFDIVLKKSLEKLKNGEIYNQEMQTLAKAVFEANLPKETLKELAETDAMFFQKLFCVAFEKFITGKTNQTTKNILEVMPEELKKSIEIFGISARQIDSQLDVGEEDSTRFFRTLFRSFPKSIVREFLNSKGNLPHGKSEFNKYLENNYGFDEKDLADIKWIFENGSKDRKSVAKKIGKLTIKGQINNKIIEAKEKGEAVDYQMILREIGSGKDSVALYETIYKCVKDGVFKNTEPDDSKILEAVIRQLEYAENKDKNDFFAWLANLGQERDGRKDELFKKLLVKEREMRDETLKIINKRNFVYDDLLNYIFGRSYNNVPDAFANKIFGEMDSKERRLLIASTIYFEGFANAQAIFNRYKLTREEVQYGTMIQNLEGYEKGLSKSIFKEMESGLINSLTEICFLEDLSQKTKDLIRAGLKKNKSFAEKFMTECVVKGSPLVRICLEAMPNDERAKAVVNLISENGIFKFKKDILRHLNTDLVGICTLIKDEIKTANNGLAVAKSIVQSLEEQMQHGVRAEYVESVKKALDYEALCERQKIEIVKAQTIIGLSDGVIESKNSAELVEEKDKKDDLYKDD